MKEITIENAREYKELLIKTGFTGFPEGATALKMNMRHALTPGDERRTYHSNSFRKILNNPENRNLTNQVISSRSELLPRGKVIDLYEEIFLSLCDFLSISKGYFGFEKLTAGKVLRKNEWHNWLNAFGQNIMSISDCQDSFIGKTIFLGRTLLIANLPSTNLGPVVNLFFNERGLETPKTIRQLETLESKNPTMISEVYFEIAVRIVRGTDNMAFALSYCIHYDAANGYPISRKSDDNLYQKYVLEILRYFPPLAKVGNRTTNDTIVIINDKLSCYPNTHVIFDVKSYNRNLKEELDPFDTIVQLNKMATFGSYTPLSCPANYFTSELIQIFLKEFWNLYKWHPNELDKESFAKNERLEVSGMITPCAVA